MPNIIINTVSIYIVNTNLKYNNLPGADNTKLSVDLTLEIVVLLFFIELLSFLKFVCLKHISLDLPC